MAIVGGAGTRRNNKDNVVKEYASRDASNRKLALNAENCDKAKQRAWQCDSFGE